MDVKRKQHILPESYLMHWADPATTAPGKTPMVWIISKDMKSKAAKPPAARHFWRDYFYDLVSLTGERHQGLENLLGKIEGAMANITRRRIPTKQPLDQDEAEAIDFFVACMFMRTERIRESILASVSAMGRIEREYAAANGRSAPDNSIRELNAHAHAIYDGLLFISDHLVRMSHNIFIAPTGRSFVTSDAPCVWQAAAGPLGLINPLLEITLPLTPQHMLHISKTIPTSGYVEAQPLWVDQTNWDTIQQCREYFISNSPVIDPIWFDSKMERFKKLLKAL